MKNYSWGKYKDYHLALVYKIDSLVIKGIESLLEYNIFR